MDEQEPAPEFTPQQEQVLKSILDNIPVKDEAFPLNKSQAIVAGLEVVSTCPICGSPIYGHKTLPPVNSTPVTVFSCDCRKSGSFEGSIKTK